MTLSKHDLSEVAPVDVDISQEPVVTIPFAFGGVAADLHGAAIEQLLRGRSGLVCVTLRLDSVVRVERVWSPKLDAPRRGRSQWPFDLSAVGILRSFAQCVFVGGLGTRGMTPLLSDHRHRATGWMSHLPPNTEL